MAIYEDELIAMIKRGEPIAKIRGWFLDELIKRKMNWEDMSPFEQAFLNQISYAYEAARREALEKKLN